MPNPKEYVMMNISSPAADILLELQTIFANLSMNLLKTISNEIRARIIIEYDEFLFNCVGKMPCERRESFHSIFLLGGHGSIVQRRRCDAVFVRREPWLVSHCQRSHLPVIQQVTESCLTLQLSILVHALHRCRESALLLTIPMGSALLLIEALEQDSSLISLANLSSYESQVSSPLPSALHEMGVHHLSEFEANQVLHHRLDLARR